MRTVLEGVDVQRGHGVVQADDGRRAELATVAVDAWHIREHGEEELPPASLGQLHQGDAYIIRWTYSITTLGKLPGVKALPHRKKSVVLLLLSHPDFVRFFLVFSPVGKRQKPGELSTGASGRERTACFFWQGRHSSISEKGTSALMTVELGSHRGAQVSEKAPITNLPYFFSVHWPLKVLQSYNVL